MKYIWTDVGMFPPTNGDSQYSKKCIGIDNLGHKWVVVYDFRIDMWVNANTKKRAKIVKYHIS